MPHTTRPLPKACSLTVFPSQSPHNSAARSLTCLVALRVILQARVLLGLRPDQRHPGGDQFLELAQHFHRHVAAVGQHEQPVGHAVGQNDPAVAHGQPREQHFGIADVVVVARPQCGIDVLGADEVRRPVAVVEQHVGDESALLEQVAATGDVVGEAAGLIPPGDLAVEMGAGAELRARRAVAAVRGAGEDEEMVEALAEGPIGGRLERGGRVRPSGGTK